MSVRYDVDRSQLEPQFDSDIYDVLAGSPFSWAVTRGKASFAEQKALYDAYMAAKAAGQEGNMAAPPGRSAHNWGLAVDVAILTPSGTSWDPTAEQWKWLFDVVDKHPRLHGGWNFGDDDHIESTAWFGKRNELKQSGKW